MVWWSGMGVIELSLVAPHSHNGDGDDAVDSNDCEDDKRGEKRHLKLLQLALSLEVPCVAMKMNEGSLIGWEGIC